MRWRVVLGGLVAIAAACTKESVRPSVVEAGVAPEGDAARSAPSATASATATASASAMATATASASAVPMAGDAAPSTTTTTTTSGTAEAKAVSLDDGAEGKTVDVAKGATVTLLLAATPSSGFDWAVLKAPAALGAPTLGFVAGGGEMGAAGKRRIVWTVKDALPAGEHAVELGYARSFEKGVAPFKTFRFKVRAAK